MINTGALCGQVSDILYSRWDYDDIYMIGRAK